MFVWDPNKAIDIRRWSICGGGRLERLYCTHIYGCSGEYRDRDRDRERDRDRDRDMDRERDRDRDRDRESEGTVMPI